MKSIAKIFLWNIIGMNITIIIGLISYFGFNVSFLLSLLIGITSGIISYYLLKWYNHRQILKENQLTSKDYNYIRSNLKEARFKIKRFNKALWSIRSFQAARQLSKLKRLINQIYHIVKKEPKRFYQAERFFFYHLDSIVELSEKYVFLTRQQLNEPQVRTSLIDAEQTLKNLVKSTNDDLLLVLANDINHLQIELDVAKQTLKREDNRV